MAEHTEASFEKYNPNRSFLHGDWPEQTLMALVLWCKAINESYLPAGQRTHYSVYTQPGRCTRLQGWKLKDKRGIAFDQVGCHSTPCHREKDAVQTVQVSRTSCRQIRLPQILSRFPFVQAREKETLGLGFSKEVGGKMKSLPGITSHTAAPNTPQSITWSLPQALTCPQTKPRARQG